MRCSSDGSLKMPEKTERKLKEPISVHVEHSYGTRGRVWINIPLKYDGGNIQNTHPCTCLFSSFFPRATSTRLPLLGALILLMLTKMKREEGSS